MAYICVAVNYYVRVCLRFLAAMRLQLVPLLHPVFLIPPLMFCFYHSLCHFVPICSINEVIHPFGLNLVCKKYATGLGVLPDYYLTPFYMLLYLLWSYSFISGEEWSPSDEMQVAVNCANVVFSIESMPPMLVGLDVSQSQVIFRYAVASKEPIDVSEDEDPSSDLRIVNTDVDKVVTLYVCATMWHETQTEMTQMLKSLFKLDEEHARRLADRSAKDRIKFRMEIHIFLDDAWEDDPECGRIPNNYFKQLFELLMELTRFVPLFATTFC